MRIMRWFRETGIQRVGMPALCLALWSAASFAWSAPVYIVRYEDDGVGTLRVIDARERDATTPPKGIEETALPQFIEEHQPVGKGRIVTLKSGDREAIDALLAARKVLPAKIRLKVADEAKSDELVTLVASGPSANRIDLVFMGDGYLASEREKFFADINRMVNEMFTLATFRSYLPLFNVHAVFRPSAQSGIGRGRPQDTAYKLYREGQTLRAIYPGDLDALRDSWSVAPDCDYPIVIANDSQYGGLGGEVAISTSSLTSGTMVLRHELGHNFGQVGEEYDGGGYFGANYSRSLRVGWEHWLTSATRPVTAEPSQARFIAWPWHNLTRGAYEAPFRSNGGWESAAIRLSASGMPDTSSMRVTLDSETLALPSAGTDDRSFYNLERDVGFAAGSHRLRFEELVRDGNNWVSSLTVHEYGSGYHKDPDYIGAYPLFTENGAVDGYRSNHETCLMRNMESSYFCKVCQENNWHEFFGKVNLIDSLTSAAQAGQVTVELQTQKVGQFREAPLDFDDAVEIKWLKNGVEVPELAHQATWTRPETEARGNWAAEVVYRTPEVRNDPRGLLSDRKTLRIDPL